MYDDWLFVSSFFDTCVCQLTPIVLLKQSITEVQSAIDEEGRSNKKINEPRDVSGSPSGVCIVTRSILLSNSHAGTHADQPVSALHVLFSLLLLFVLFVNWINELIQM